MIDARTRLRARLVTYGLVATLAVAAIWSLEPWPVSSFRLFSERRTGTRTALVLEAVREDGTRMPVQFGRDVRLTRSIQRQLPQLEDHDERARVTKVRAWLEASGLDPDAFTVVSVVAVRRRLDPHGGAAVELDRDVLYDVELD